MPLDIQIRQFVGVERADIMGLDKIALVCGGNATGKTSILQAIGGVLCANPLMRGITLKGKGKALVRAGADKAQCRIATDAGANVALMIWPDGTYKTKGDPASAIPWACGVSHISALDDKARTAVLIDILGATPTRADVVTFLVDNDLGNPVLHNRVWDQIADKGWDVYWKEVKEKGTEKKGAWAQITGENWGKSKSVNWVPKGWNKELAKLGETKLIAAITHERRVLENLLRNSGASEGRIAELQRSIDGEDQAQEDLEKAERAKADWESNLENWIKEQKEIDVPPIQEPFPCPKCGTLLHFGSNVGVELPVVIAEHPAISRRKVMDLQTQASALDSQIQGARRRIKEHNEKIFECNTAITAANNARTEIDKVKTRSVSDEEIEKQREAVAIAEANLKRFQQHRDAENKHRSIASNMIVQDCLRPDGLRKTVLQRKLNDFNERLKDLSNRLKLDRPVEIAPDIRIMFGPREFSRLSTSEKIRANLVVTLALAQVTDAPLVLIDDLDTIEPAGRPPIFHLLRYVNIPAVVAFMATNIDTFPNMTKFKMGQTYFMQENQLLKVEHEE